MLGFGSWDFGSDRSIVGLVWDVLGVCCRVLNGVVVVLDLNGVILKLGFNGSNLSIFYPSICWGFNDSISFRFGDNVLVLISNDLEFFILF